MQCVVLAGGLGTRMSRFTSTLPKALIPVRGVPFLRLKLEGLADQGVTDVIISTGHLGDQIEDEVRNHAPAGQTVRCIADGPELLGTGGALRRVSEEVDLDQSFLLTYGDSHLPCDHRHVFESFDPAHFDGLMTLWPVGATGERPNATLSADRVTDYDKQTLTPAMAWVDYGLLVLKRDAVEQMIPPRTPCDLANFCSQLARTGRLQGLEVPERYFEIGSEAGLAQLEDHLDQKGHR